MSHEFELEKPIRMIDIGRGDEVIGQQISLEQSEAILDWCIHEKEAEAIGRSNPDGSVTYNDTRMLLKLPNGESVAVVSNLLWGEGMEEPIMRYTLNCSSNTAMEMEKVGLIQIDRGETP